MHFCRVHCIFSLWMLCKENLHRKKSLYLMEFFYSLVRKGLAEKTLYKIRISSSSTATETFSEVVIVGFTRE